MSEQADTLEKPKEATSKLESPPPPAPPQGKVTSEDLDFISDCRAAFLQEKMTYANVAIATIIAFAVVFLLWASKAEVDEVTRGQGSVIPSASVHSVQNLEGGIISSFATEVGAKVEAGQTLLRLDDTAYEASFNEAQIKLETLYATEARLKAESTHSNSIEFPQSIVEHRPDLVLTESQLFDARRNSYLTKVSHAESSLELKTREWEITKPLADSGVVSKIEIIRLETAVNDAQAQLEQTKADYMSEVVATFNDTTAQINQLEQNIITYQDKLERTNIRSPINGIVNKVHLQNIGGIVRSGEPIVDIVPIEGGFLVEADVTPQDIAFIEEGMDATVKITAYDFAIFGGLRGTVAHISSDTISNEKGERFYKVRVKTGERSLKNSSEDLPILPGMEVQLDILTGKKTILQYLLKPLMRAKMNAFTEK